MTSTLSPKGRLYLVPTPLDHGCDVALPLTHMLPQGSIETAATLTHWISENAKSTRAFLKRVQTVVPLAAALQAQHIIELPREVHKKGDHSPTAARLDAAALLAPALQGHDMGLISEAGMPAVADPGSSVVRAAHGLRLRVVPLAGPTAIVLALAASGLNGQHFAFVGYLPQDATARAQRARELEALALKTGQTQLFIETPYRNAALLQALLHALKPTTRLAVASALTLPQEHIRSHTVAEWRKQHVPADGAHEAMHAPSLFAIGA